MVLLTATTFAAAKKPNDGFVTLFNGKDLSGWTTTGNWLPQRDGSLSFSLAQEKKAGSDMTTNSTSEKKYKDFTEIEYKYPKEVIVECTFALLTPKTLSIQASNVRYWIHSANQTRRWGTMTTAGSFVRLARPRTCRRSQEMEQDDRDLQKGYHLQVNLNGENIIDYQLNTKGEGKLSGVADRPLEGYISLQDHGEPNNLFFRNIRIKNYRDKAHASIQTTVSWSSANSIFIRRINTRINSLPTLSALYKRPSEQLLQSSL